MAAMKVSTATLLWILIAALKSTESLLPAVARGHIRNRQRFLLSTQPLPPEPTEYFIVTPEGLNIQVLSTDEQPAIATEKPATSTATSTATATATATTQLATVQVIPTSRWEIFFKRIASSLEVLWREFMASPTTENTDRGNKENPSAVVERSPIVFIHGSFHAAWCFAERYFGFFSSPEQGGRICYAVSLRGTSATGMPPGDTSAKIDIDDHTNDVRSVCDKIVWSQQSKRLAVMSCTKKRIYVYHTRDAYFNPYNQKTRHYRTFLRRNYLNEVVRGKIVS
jgi:hypothetical protein